MAEEAKNIRRTVKTRFTRKRNELLKPIHNGGGIEVMESNNASLVEAWNIVESKHDLYTMYLRDDEIEAADEWIISPQDLFAEATTIKISHVNNLEVVNARARPEAERLSAKN